MTAIPSRERRIALAKSALCLAISGAILYNELLARAGGPAMLGIFMGIFFLGFVPAFQIDRGDGKLVSPIVLLAHLIVGGTAPPKPRDQSNGA